MIIEAEIAEKVVFNCDITAGGHAGGGGESQDIPTFVTGAKWEVGSNAGIPIKSTPAHEAGDKVYTFGDANGYDASGDFSFQVHFKFNSFIVTGGGGTANEEQRSGIVCKHSGNYPGSGSGYAVYGIRYPNASAAGYHMRIGSSPNIGVGILGIGDLDVNDTSGEHDIAVVVTGGKIYGYVDGELESTNDFAGDIDRSQILMLGMPVNSVSQNISWFPYDSTVYSFLGYDRALTAEEVAQNADAGFKLATPYTTICPDGDAGFWALSGQMSCIMCGSIAGTGEEDDNNYTIGYSIGNSEGTITLSAQLKANGFSVLPSGTEQRLKAVNVIDNINMTTGEVIYNNSVGSHTFDGTEAITKSGNRYLYRAHNGTTGITNNDICCYCPTMPEKTAQNIYTNRNTANYVGVGFNADGDIVIIDNTQSWASADEFKTYLSQLDPPLTVYYVPERSTQTLTPAPGISQKEGTNDCDYTTNPPGYLILTGNVKER